MVERDVDVRTRGGPLHERRAEQPPDALLVAVPVEAEGAAHRG